MNFIPIALKKIEKIVVKKLTAFLETNHLMNPTQHGFQARRSYLPQLPSHYELVIKALESDKKQRVAVDETLPYEPHVIS